MTAMLSGKPHSRQTKLIQQVSTRVYQNWKLAVTAMKGQETITVQFGIQAWEGLFAFSKHGNGFLLIM
jgi:hypothetical protein